MVYLLQALAKYTVLISFIKVIINNCSRWHAYLYKLRFGQHVFTITCSVETGFLRHDPTPTNRLHNQNQQL